MFSDDLGQESESKIRHKKRKYPSIVVHELKDTPFKLKHTDKRTEKNRLLAYNLIFIKFQISISLVHSCY